MSLMTGKHLDKFLAQRPSQKLRNEIGAHLFELFYAQLLKVEALHADPHPGNYLFGNDAGISLVDFGCVKYFRPESMSYLRSVLLYPGSRASAGFRRLLEKGYRLAGQPLSAETQRALIGFADNFYRLVYPPEPEKREQLFDFGDTSFLQKYVQASSDMFRSKGVLTDLIYLGRTEMGLYQMLHRLKARLPTSQLLRKYL
jgi:predicted unusual protein kinase regulating ubiquinone biosynthesis (AarF/ABC1/UbiB family)